MKKHSLSVFVTFQEMRWGIRYLLFQHIFLPVLLSYISMVLPRPLDSHAINFLYYCVNFGAAVLIFRGFLLRSFRRAVENVGRTALFTLLGFALYWAFNAGMTWIITRLVPDFVNINDQTVASMLRQWYGPMAFATVVLVPLAEECMYRGVFFSGLYRKSPAAAYLVSTVLFCCIHVSNYVGTVSPEMLALCFVQYIPAGLILAWAYEGADTIAAPIAIHMLINALGVIMMR